MGSVSEISDAELIRRVISGCACRIARSKRSKTQFLWRVVGDRFCLGSTYAGQLCQRFGFDPDLQVRP